MVSALYAVLGALLLVKFSFDVVRLRTQYHVGYGDGGFGWLILPRTGFHHRVYYWRRSGMSATWCALLLMVLANLWYMPWELVFSLR